MKKKINATALALEQLANALKGIPREEQHDFIQAFTCLSIGLMRGSMGDTFTHEFLTGAMNDLEGKSAEVSITTKH